MSRAEDIFREDLEADLQNPEFSEMFHRTLQEIAWTPDVHDTSDDTLTVEAAADRLEQKLGE